MFNRQNHFFFVINFQSGEVRKVVHLDDRKLKGPIRKIHSDNETLMRLATRVYERRITDTSVENTCKNKVETRCKREL